VAQKNTKVPEFLREPLLAAQARLEQLEEETQRVVKDLMVRGKASRRELTEMVQRLAKQDWTLDELRGRVEKLRSQGMELASDYADRARAEAAGRLVELQTKAISFLGVASREQVEELSRELSRLTKKIEKGSDRGGEKGTDRAKVRKPAGRGEEV